VILLHDLSPFGFLLSFAAKKTGGRTYGSNPAPCHGVKDTEINRSKLEEISLLRIQSLYTGGY
jgi:hypothetical protein